MEYSYQFEEWRDIISYEGLYQVSNLGRVRSLGNGNSRNSKERLLKPTDTKGYLQVCLYKDGKKKHFRIHRLVALAFLPNPYNLPEVNHINEDKTDNRACNLEWCDSKYNTNYGTRNDKISESLTNGKLSKPVNQFTKEGILIAQYPSAIEAYRQTGYSFVNISKCCNGGYFNKRRGKWVNVRQMYGYIWKWAE